MYVITLGGAENLCSNMGAPSYVGSSWNSEQDQYILQSESGKVAFHGRHIQNQYREMDFLSKLYISSTIGTQINITPLSFWVDWPGRAVKLMFSKKATKIDEIFTLCSKCQIDSEDIVYFVAFLENTNFNCQWFLNWFLQTVTWCRQLLGQ